jgi:hypothetical protein
LLAATAYFSLLLIVSLWGWQLNGVMYELCVSM